MTASPTSAWIWQQVINANHPWGTGPSHLIHDQDTVYGGEFGNKLERIGIVDVPTPVRAHAPTQSQNAW